MALGETQIVSETREFLTDNGVVLDSFNQVGCHGIVLLSYYGLFTMKYYDL